MKHKDVPLKTSLFKLSLITLALTGLTGCDDENNAPTVSSNAPVSIDERTSTSLSVTAKDADGSIKSYKWSQDSGPELSFTDSGSSIEFDVPEVTEDTTIGFTVTVMDNDGDAASTSFSTLIKHVNRAPITEDIELDIEFNDILQFSLPVSDLDGDTLTASFPAQQSIGSIELLDADEHQYQYTSASDNISPDTINIEISDGVDTAVAIVSLNIVDNSSPNAVSVTPAVDSERVEVNTQVIVEFDDVMSAIADVDANTCMGPIQISLDNFQTCSPYSVVSANQKLFTLTPNTLEFGRTYQVKVTADASNFHSVAAEEATLTTFRTANNDLQITEISSSKYWDDNRWLEIFNGTNREINLSNYAVHTETIDLDTYTELGLQTFSLPEKVIEPGNYIVVQGRFGNGYWQSSVEESSQQVLIGNDSDNIRPYWDESGFVELLNKDETETVDFYRFGEDAQEPVTAAQWDTRSSGPGIHNTLGMSIIRTMGASDTNSSNDWRVAQFMTPGGQNDVTCTEDLDADGIPDCAETEGSTFAGLPLYDWGARVGVKDIFVEVDYMQSDDPGITPHQEALQKVVDVFAQQEVAHAIHFDVGDLYHQEEGTSTEYFDLGGGNEVDFYLQASFESSDTTPSIVDLKVKHSDIRRKPIFHYLLMANSQKADGSGGSSGYAEMFGNDLIVSIGSWGLEMETETGRNQTINYQSSTILHELGHNLGLRHGGDENRNWKPNHISSMNYLYQLNGLPTIGEREGDRYYKAYFWGDLECNLEDNELVNGPTASPEDFKLNYSSGTSANIDKTSIDESLGFQYANSVAVDFNCNGNANDVLNNFDLDWSGSSTDTIRDVDEWAMLDLQFTKYWSGNVSGADNSTKSDDSPQNVMNNDKQVTIKEEAPSEQFFREVQMLNSL